MHLFGRLTLAAIFMLTSGSFAHAAIVFQDDFSAAKLDTSKWSVGTWTTGRTQFGNTPTLSGGAASLEFDTYNAANPGQTFKGTSITIKTPFSRGQGLELDARVRTNLTPGGLVTSFFTYGAHNGLSDEIDFEHLSNAFSSRSGGDSLSLTSYNDWNAADPDPNNPANHSTATVKVPSLDLTQYTTLSIRWYTDHTEWLVNGQVVRTSTDALPDDPMSLSLNFWAPTASWASAYSAALMPSAAAAGGSSYFYDIDSVTVQTLPEPCETAILAGILGVLAGRRRRAQAFGNNNFNK